MISEMDNTTQLGTKTYSCPTCSSEHTAPVLARDVQRGYLLESCPDRGGMFNQIIIKRQEPRAMQEPVARHSNYPDNLDVEAAGLF